jgi:hypothetical protein
VDNFSFTFKYFFALLIDIFLLEGAEQAGIVRTSLSNAAIRSEMQDKAQTCEVEPALK